MKIRIRNVDFEPFEKETDLPEADDLYPHLRVRHYGDTVLSVALKPGPFVELVLVEKDLALKRGSALTSPGARDEMETVVSTAEGAVPAKVEGPLESEGAKMSFLRRLFGCGKKAGMRFRVRIKDLEQYVFETEMSAGRYERGVFQGTQLNLDRYADGIAVFSIKPGPMLEMFLMNGTMWRVDAKDEEQIIMSTEEADLRVREGQELSDSAKAKKVSHFGSSI
jgi:hypothetical protein